MANARNRKGKQLPVRRVMRAGPNWPLFVLAVLGLGLTGYLSYSALFSERVAFCTAGAGCDVVLNSRWSTLFGVPTAVLVTLTSLAIITLSTYANPSLLLLQRNSIHGPLEWPHTWVFGSGTAFQHALQGALGV